LWIRGFLLVKIPIDTEVTFLERKVAGRVDPLARCGRPQVQRMPSYNPEAFLALINLELFVSTRHAQI